ncbi:hypothetical protein N9M21_00595 [Alphaproteobacteria bacterium]|nr:hypothetical protein [Alphaproteobacteria bacterium]
MTARGWVIAGLRLAALGVGGVAVSVLVFDRLNQPVKATGPALLGSSAAEAPEGTGVALRGPVSIVGPAGSVLGSQTGADFDPDTGNLTLLGASRLSGTHE